MTDARLAALARRLAEGLHWSAYLAGGQAADDWQALIERTAALILEGVHDREASARARSAWVEDRIREALKEN